MQTAQLELALKKQRLQITGDALRRDLAQHAAGLVPVFTAADRVAEGAAWIRRHPQILVAATVALAVAKPRRAWRWGRRAFVGWQSWRRLRAFLEHRQPV